MVAWNVSQTFRKFTERKRCQDHTYPTYSANETLAFILASDSDSNGSFGDESSLDSSNSHDSEEELCFRGTEVDEIQEKDQYDSKISIFFFFGTDKPFYVRSLFWVDKAVANRIQSWNTL